MTALAFVYRARAAGPSFAGPSFAGPTFTGSTFAGSTFADLAGDTAALANGDHR